MIGKFNSIRIKTAGMVLVLLVASCFAFYMITVSILNRYLLNEVLKRSEAISKSVAVSAGYSLLTKDVLGLDNMVFRTRNTNPDVESIAIIDTNRKIITHSDIAQTGQIQSSDDSRVPQENANGVLITKSTRAHTENFEITTPIISFNKRLGSVILKVNKSELQAASQAAQNRIMIFFAGILLLGIGASIPLSSFLTKPIEELSKGVEKLKEGKEYCKLKIYSQDEFGKLTANFNEMVSLIDVQNSKLSHYARELEDSYVSTVKVLAAAIDARDPYTLGHSARVSMLSLQLGREIGLDAQSIEELEVACLFHDIGKIKTPDSILRKRDKLTIREYNEMMRHTEYGAEILSKAASLQKYIPAVRHHHEWFNGKGYPEGLKQDAIPLFAAIIAITDTFDAMTSNRPYRSAISDFDTLEEIKRYSGQQFHPDLADVFIRMMDKKIVGDIGGPQGNFAGLGVRSLS